MDVYFVRHGETECNRRHIHQTPNTPLTPKGRNQAVTAGEYVRRMNPDLIVTSSYTRAKETAGVIGGLLGLEPVVSELFREVRRPAELYGKSHYHPLTLWYAFLSVLKRKNKSWRYSDAESFPDVRKRVHEALEYIEDFEGEHKSIVIVSHTIFINLLVAYMCTGGTLRMGDLLPHLLHVVKMKNGQVIHLKFIGKSNKNICRWQRVDN